MSIVQGFCWGEGKQNGGRSVQNALSLCAVDRANPLIK